MQDFSAPIVQQPRLVLVLPVVILVLTIVGANVAWYLTRSMGAAQSMSGMAAAAVFVAGIAFAITSSLGSQGTVSVTEGQLVVDGRWRGARRVPLGNAEIEPVVWRRGGVTHLVVGVILNVRGTDGSNVTVGSSDPGMADELIQRGVESTTVPPRATLEPADFRQLMASLGAGAATEGTY